MNAVGLVTEYNPFHNGHQYHLRKAQELTKADVTVVLMSGNFVQRGEPAILDKWQRANEALACGADLVVELPFCYSVQPAHLFAWGAVKLLDSMKTKSFVFGSEHPDWDFEKLVKIESSFDDQQFDQYDATYATLFNQQLQQNSGISLDHPNDILAYGYTKAKSDLHSGINLIPIQRIDASYNDDQIEDHDTIASATAVRESIINGTQAYRHVVPTQTRTDIEQLTTTATWNNFYPFLRYQITQSPISSLGQIYQMAEGLEYRMKRVAENAETFSSFLEGVKSKRYTYSRLERVALYALLQVTETEMSERFQRPYLRILGFTNRGKEYLHLIKKDLDIPLVTKLDLNLKHNLVNLDYRAGKMYEQVTGNLQDMRKKPIIY